MPIVLVAAGFVVVLGIWAAYLATIPSGKVPRRPVGHALGLIAGMGLAVIGLVLAAREGGATLAIAGALAFVPLMMGGMFFYLLAQRKTPVGDLRVRLGDTLPAFTALDSKGETFHSDSLRGQRALLKFFRGHW